MYCVNFVCGTGSQSLLLSFPQLSREHVAPVQNTSNFPLYCQCMIIVPGCSHQHWRREVGSVARHHGFKKRGLNAPWPETSNRFACFAICHMFSPSSQAIMTQYCGVFARRRMHSYSLIPIKAKTYSPQWNSLALVFKCSLFGEGGCETSYFRWSTIADTVGLDI